MIKESGEWGGGVEAVRRWRASGKCLLADAHESPPLCQSACFDFFGVCVCVGGGGSGGSAVNERRGERDERSPLAAKI